jgi:glycosyltransferase involved in cell wall biosynthesis
MPEADSEPLRVAVALTQPPLPEGGAPGKCAIGLLRGLGAHGVAVRAVAARQSFAQPGDPPADLPVELVEIAPERPGPRTRALAYLRPRGELGRGPFAARFREVAAEADVAHLEETEAAPAGRGLEQPTVVHVHYLAGLDRDLGPPWRRQFRDVLLFTLAERRAVAGSRYLVASSPLIADALRRARPNAEVVVAPLSLDPAFYPQAPLDGPPLAGMIGTATWPGTAAAMRRLVYEVWPLVRKIVPEAQLVVAGRGTEQLIDVAAEPGVEILGAVPSAADWLRDLSVLLFPIVRGSGMKVKVLEAMACGVPVVTTPAGAEGIRAAGGVMVEHDDRHLAHSAAAIMQDALERSERGAVARAAFLKHHSPVPATEPLVELYRRIAGG